MFILNTILISDPIQEEGIAALVEDPRCMVLQKNVNDATKEELDKVDALMVRSGTKVTSEVMEMMPNLKIIGRAGVGVDNIQIEEASKRGILVINAPNGNTISTAEHTFAMMAALLRKIPQATQSIKSGKWNRKEFQGQEIYGKTLGVIGFGRIGTELSKRVKAFGMNVLVYDPFLTEDRAKKNGVTLTDLNALLENSDIITVHTPLTEDTRHLINQENIYKTKKGVYFLNCARGGIIDEDALYQGISSGHVRGAALDVFDVEPPTNRNLLELDEVVATPHIAASTEEAQTNVAKQISEDFLRFIDGDPVSSAINLPQLTKDEFSVLSPFFDLVKQMGNFTSQCMKSPVKKINITYGGKITELDTQILSRWFVRGFLSARVDQTINEVNAFQVCQHRGISFSETLQDDTHGFTNIIEATIYGENHSFTIMGTYIPEVGPRIIRLNGFSVDFYPENSLLYIHHNDQPGVIGMVGQFLGNAGLNIATMVVGRKSVGGDAIMVLSFDEPIPSHIVEEIQSNSIITNCQRIVM